MWPAVYVQQRSPRPSAINAGCVLCTCLQLHRWHVFFCVWCRGVSGLTAAFLLANALGFV